MARSIPRVQDGILRMAEDEAVQPVRVDTPVCRPWRTASG